MANLAGVLRGRTMYVVPYAGLGPSEENRVGLVVTDSPHVVDTLHQRFVTDRTALDAIRASNEMEAELHLVFPPRHLTAVIPRDAPELRAPFGPCEAGRARRRDLPLTPTATPPAKASPCAVCQRICPNREVAWGTASAAGK
jgi:hypothetical protein